MVQLLDQLSRIGMRGGVEDVPALLSGGLDETVPMVAKRGAASLVRKPPEAF